MKMKTQLFKLLGVEQKQDIFITEHVLEKEKGLRKKSKFLSQGTRKGIAS